MRFAQALCAVTLLVVLSAGVALPQRQSSQEA